MEALSHDLFQWGAYAGAILGIWRVWAMLNKNIAERVNMERDIRDLQEDVERIDDRKANLYAKLDDILDRLARIETKLESK